MKELPPFPDIVPSKIAESVLYVVEADDIQTEADLQKFILLLYNYQKRRREDWKSKRGLQSRRRARAILQKRSWVSRTILRDRHIQIFSSTEIRKKTSLVPYYRRTFPLGVIGRFQYEAAEVTFSVFQKAADFF